MLCADRRRSIQSQQRLLCCARARPSRSRRHLRNLGVPRQPRSACPQGTARRRVPTTETLAAVMDPTSGPPIGSRISHYRILSHLGTGGMGAVYRARDERLDRDVALKVLLAESVDDVTARARLVREA